MDNSDALKAASNYAAIIRQEYPKADIYLFGSRSTGEAHAESDIDIAIIVEKTEGNWLDKTTRLWLLTQEISPYIEPVLLSDEHDESGFIQHVRETGIPL